MAINICDLNLFYSEVITATSDTQEPIVFPSKHFGLGGENEIDGENLIVPVENKSDQLWIDILTQVF